MPRNTTERVTADCPRCDYPDALKATVHRDRCEPSMVEFATPTWCPKCGAQFTDQEQRELYNEMYVAAVTPEYDEDEDKGFPARAA